MNVKIIFIVPILILFYLSLSISTLCAGDEDKSIMGFPDYTAVDVLVVCDWGVTEKYESVDVYDQAKSKEPHLTIDKANKDLLELILIKGIKVSILNHENHELLKTYTGNYEK